VFSWLPSYNSSCKIIDYCGCRRKPAFGKLINVFNKLLGLYIVEDSLLVVGILPRGSDLIETPGKG